MRRPAILRAVVFVLVAALTVGAGRSPAATAAPPLAVTLSVSGHPTSGLAPLDVAFQAEASPGTVSGTFYWTFGDGSTFSQNATGSSTVDHRFALPGAFTVRVSLSSPSGSAFANTVIGVNVGPLAVAVVATPAQGSVPLTVHFTATPKGGTDTYSDVRWSFGDGDNGSGADLNYTYSRAGTFTAQVTVTDTAGTSNSSAVSIEADPAPMTPGTLPGPDALLPIALAAAAGLAVVAIVVGGYRFHLARRDRTMMSVAPSTAPAGISASATSAMVASPESMAVPAAPRSGREASRQLSERLLVHLYWYGRSGTGGTASSDTSQAGMARRLGATQNGVSKALQRLIDAGLVRSELGHVPGASRRLKTYSLTPRGEAVARTLKPESSAG